MSGGITLVEFGWTGTTFRNRGKPYYIYATDEGEVWSRVHAPQLCAGEYCCVHNPSDHSMRSFPMHLRETGLVERICPHGVGHPDPDSARYLDREGPEGARGSWTVHGCDGCCQNPQGGASAPSEGASPA